MAVSVSQPMAPGAVGWIPASLGGMLAHPGCLGVWGETGVQQKRCAERLCCPLRNVQGKELLLW